MSDDSTKIVELNVGGTIYLTTVETLKRDENSLIAKLFYEGSKSAEDSGKIIRQSGDDRHYFIDRNGELFRYILDYLRNDKRLILPEKFSDFARLRNEAKFYKMDDLIRKLSRLIPSSSSTATNAVLQTPLNFSLPLLNSKTSYSDAPASKGDDGGGGADLSPNLNGRSGEDSAKSDGAIRHSSSTPDPLLEGGHVTVGYRGTFAFGRDGKGDVKFRKLNRILICGKAQLCKRVFGDALNESRDPDRGGLNRYTSRLYLKHANLEWAFDTLTEHGFALTASCASGTCFAGLNDTGHAGRGADGEEQRWNHYNEFVFYKPPE